MLETIRGCLADVPPDVNGSRDMPSVNVTWLEAEELSSYAARRIKQVAVGLDIGPGIRPQEHVKLKVHICCEPFAQYVERLKQNAINDYDRKYVVLNVTWEEACRIFPPRSVDTVFLLDVVEHLEKEESLKLLKATEQIARQQVVIFTPLGFMPQEHPDGKDHWGMEGGSWQTHKSGWLPEDFDESWEIYAAREFHTHDNLGRRLEKPYGAMWAIKNVKDTSPLSQVRIVGKRQKAHVILDKMIDMVTRSYR
jgi:hypothetical protein